MGGPFLSDQERKQIAANSASRTRGTQTSFATGNKAPTKTGNAPRHSQATLDTWRDDRLDRWTPAKAAAAEQSRKDDAAFSNSVWTDWYNKGLSGNREGVTFGPKYGDWSNQPGGAPPAPPGPAGPSGPGPGGGGGGGGGGGYGGMNPAKWKQYQDAILAMVGQVKPADVGAAPQDLLSGLVNSGVDSSKADSAAAYGGVADMIANAYNDMQVMDAPQFDPQIAALLEAQGMGTDYAQAAQMMGQGGLNDVAGLFGQHKNQMAAATDQYNASRNADVDELAAHSGSEMEAQRVALLAQAAVQHQAQTKQYEQAQLQAAYAAEQQKRELLLNLLGSGLGSGADMSGIDIAKLLGGA